MVVRGVRSHDGRSRGIVGQLRHIVHATEIVSLVGETSDVNLNYKFAEKLEFPRVAMFWNSTKNDDLIRMSKCKSRGVVGMKCTTVSREPP